jgi:hypothetical protein
MTQAPIDLIEQHQREMAEQEAAAERGRMQNVNRFVEMWLTLGSDVIRAGGSSHQPELAEALGLASNRWGRLLDAEAQIGREEQLLASRPKTRPSQFGDDALPDRTIEKQARAWVDQTKHMQASLAELKAQVKAERKELESFITKGR